LISNAADAIEERQEKSGLKDPQGHIRISGNACSREGHEGVEILVEDNGTGVPTELREKIHEAFFTTKPIGKGTGLGMAITERILKEHEAVLSIGDSELGGAAFKIWVPSSMVDV
jgi:C4-dicarboxylate-specific signal transduction histidine kinase